MKSQLSTPPKMSSLWNWFRNTVHISHWGQNLTIILATYLIKCVSFWWHLWFSKENHRSSSIFFSFFFFRWCNNGKYMSSLPTFPFFLVVPCINSKASYLLENSTIELILLWLYAVGCTFLLPRCLVNKLNSWAPGHSVWYYSVALNSLWR